MTVLHPLQRPLVRLMHALSKHLPKAVEGEAEPLHQGRVATRRLREILPLCACEVPRRLADRARRRARRVGRALGGVREIDVSIGVVDEMIAAGRVDVVSGRRLTQGLQEERDRRRERMLDQVSSVKTPKLERDLADVARALAMRQQTDEWAQMLAVRIHRRSEDAQCAVGEAGALYVSDRVHRVRIASKKLRYALELAGETSEATMGEAVQRLKEIQDALGRLHDLEVLGWIIRDLAIPDGDASASPEFEALRVGLEGECRQLHSRYVGARDLLLQICREAATSATDIWMARGGELSRPGQESRAGRVVRMTISVPGPATRRVSD